MKITADFALLDVKHGRVKLAKLYRDKPKLGPIPKEYKIPVTLTGYVTGVWGRDDGTSQEFIVDIEKVKIKL